MSDAVRRVASIEKPCRKSAMRCVALGAAFGVLSVARFSAVAGMAQASPLLAPPRDHVALVVEPERAVLVEHLFRGLQIATVGGRFRNAMILDLRHIDRSVPRREQRRRADGR